MAHWKACWKARTETSSVGEEATVVKRARYALARCGAGAHAIEILTDHIITEIRPTSGCEEWLLCMGRRVHGRRRLRRGQQRATKSQGPSPQPGVPPPSRPSLRPARPRRLPAPPLILFLPPAPRSGRGAPPSLRGGAPARGSPSCPLCARPREATPNPLAANRRATYLQVPRAGGKRAPRAGVVVAHGRQSGNVRIGGLPSAAAGSARRAPAASASAGVFLVRATILLRGLGGVARRHRLRLALTQRLKRRLGARRGAAQPLAVARALGVDHLDLLPREGAQLAEDRLHVGRHRATRRGDSAELKRAELSGQDEAHERGAPRRTQPRRLSGDAVSNLRPAAQNGRWQVWQTIKTNKFSDRNMSPGIVPAPRGADPAPRAGSAIERAGDKTVCKAAAATGRVSSVIRLLSRRMLLQVAAGRSASFGDGAGILVVLGRIGVANKAAQLTRDNPATT